MNNHILPNSPLPYTHKMCVRQNQIAALLQRVRESNGPGSAAVSGRINPTTDPTTRFNHANPAPDNSPAGGGQKCPRSCTRWKKQRPRERGRPRPHQPDNRSYDPFQSHKSCARRFTGWGRARMPALLHALEKATAPGARPSPAASTRHPILHPFQSHKSCPRPFTGWGRARMPALPQRVRESNSPGSAAVPGRINPTTDRTTRFNHTNPAPEHSPIVGGQECPRSCTRWRKQRRSGARPSPAASTRQPILRPASITQILRPTIHRLVAGKNARAPARAGKGNGPRSAAVPGRINPAAFLLPHVRLLEEREPLRHVDNVKRSHEKLRRALTANRRF